MQWDSVFSLKLDDFDFFQKFHAIISNHIAYIYFSSKKHLTFETHEHSIFIVAAFSMYETAFLIRRKETVNKPASYNPQIVDGVDGSSLSTLTDIFTNRMRSVHPVFEHSNLKRKLLTMWLVKQEHDDRVVMSTAD